jgi:hypothetical protein
VPFFVFVRDPVERTMAQWRYTLRDQVRSLCAVVPMRPQRTRAARRWFDDGVAFGAFRAWRPTRAR